MLRYLVFEDLQANTGVPVLPLCGTAAAAASIILMSGIKRNPSTRAWFIFLASAAVFCFSGFLPGGRGSISWIGLPVNSVSGLTVNSAADSRTVSGGRYLVEADIIRASDNRGASADGSGRVFLYFTGDPAVSAGEILRIQTTLHAEPAYEQYLRAQKVEGRSLLKEPLVFSAYPRAGSLERLGWKSRPYIIRASVMEAIRKRADRLDAGAGGLLMALLTGRRDGLSFYDRQMFREAGCSHILALSGMHLGIISAVILLLLRPIPGRKTAFVISCFLIFLYLFLTGFGTSIVRAAVMYFLFGLSRSFYRKSRGIDVLLLSFVIMLCIDPQSFYYLSFQLSFLAVGGIILLSPGISGLLQRWLPPVVCLPVAVSAAAQLAVIPLLLITFGVIYPAGTAAALIIAPFATLFIWTGIIFLVTGLDAVSFITELIYKAIYITAETASGFPSVRYSAGTVWLIPASAAAAVLILVYSSRRRRNAGLSVKL